MKKLILCSLVAVSVAFGMDCDEMIERYKNNTGYLKLAVLAQLAGSCFDNNNADACYCAGYITALASQTLLDSGNYNKAIEGLGHSMKLIDRACQLGSREACSSLDRINGGKK